MEIWALFLQAGPVAKAVVAILFLLSVGSWAVILHKWWVFLRSEREDRRFLRALWGGYLEKLPPEELPGRGPLGRVWRRVQGGTTLARAKLEERMRLERYLPFLATTANTAPFIGLFGTVWGIMEAFRRIGVHGASSLAVVAPGIAEALISTAAGLATAIPAVVAYNHFLHRLEAVVSRMEAFSDEIEGERGRQA